MVIALVNISSVRLRTLSALVQIAIGSYPGPRSTDVTMHTAVKKHITRISSKHARVKRGKTLLVGKDCEWTLARAQKDFGHDVLQLSLVPLERWTFLIYLPG